jgi:catecholate siderophore receptor
MFSYRGAVTYKPQENGSIYLGYGTSFNPAAEGLTLSEGATAAANINLDPEESRTVELGTKWDVLDERLSLTAALFRTEKTNARTEDPTNPGDVLVLDGEQVVQGFEFGFSGQVMDNWRLIGGYTFLDSEITESNNPLEEGNEVSNTPEHSFSLWTVHTLPAGFEAALGAQYVDSRFNNTRGDTRQEAPGYLTLDGMISYRVNENVTLRLNAYNLTDKEYIDRVGGGHFIPGQGRSAVLSANITF